jgi:hypothetical protein
MATSTRPHERLRTGQPRLTPESPEPSDRVCHVNAFGGLQDRTLRGTCGGGGDTATGQALGDGVKPLPGELLGEDSLPIGAAAGSTSRRCRRPPIEALPGDGVLTGVRALVAVGRSPAERSAFVQSLRRGRRSPGRRPSTYRQRATSRDHVGRCPEGSRRPPSLLRPGRMIARWGSPVPGDSAVCRVSPVFDLHPGLPTNKSGRSWVHRVGGSLCLDSRRAEQGSQSRM